MTPALDALIKEVEAPVCLSGEEPASARTMYAPRLAAMLRVAVEALGPAEDFLSPDWIENHDSPNELRCRGCSAWQWVGGEHGEFNDVAARLAHDDDCAYIGVRAALARIEAMAKSGLPGARS